MEKPCVVFTWTFDMSLGNRLEECWNPGAKLDLKTKSNQRVSAECYHAVARFECQVELCLFVKRMVSQSEVQVDRLGQPERFSRGEKETFQTMTSKHGFNRLITIIITLNNPRDGHRRSKDNHRSPFLILVFETDSPLVCICCAWTPGDLWTRDFWYSLVSLWRWWGALDPRASCLSLILSYVAMLCNTVVVMYDICVKWRIGNYAHCIIRNSCNKTCYFQFYLHRFPSIESFFAPHITVWGPSFVVRIPPGRPPRPLPRLSFWANNFKKRKPHTTKERTKKNTFDVVIPLAS